MQQKATRIYQAGQLKFTPGLNSNGASVQFPLGLDDGVLLFSPRPFSAECKSVGRTRTAVTHHSGKMFLHFHEDWVRGEAHFRASWQDKFPSLVPFCELEAAGCVLKVKQDKQPNSLAEVSALCKNMLEINLIPSMEPTWLVIRRTNPDLARCRPAYYFVALFILSSVVRYQPELMLALTSTNSK